VCVCIGVCVADALDASVRVDAGPHGPTAATWTALSALQAKYRMKKQSVAAVNGAPRHKEHRGGAGAGGDKPQEKRRVVWGVPV
jgi:hypothetical protein